MKMITNISGSYEQRLAQLGLTPLEENRQWGEMVEMYKLMTGNTRGTNVEVPTCCMIM